LLLAVLVAVIPNYWESKIDSIPLLAPPPIEIPKTRFVEDKIQKNRTLVATLVDYDVPIAIAYHVADLIHPVFDLRKMRFGNPFRLEKETDGTLKGFEYKIDEESVLRVQKGSESYEAKVEKLDLDSREKIITAEIHTSLWEALSDLPRREYLATELAEIFQWQVDFSTEIQPGDQIRLIVDEFLHDGAFVKYGKIQAADLVNAGRHYRGFRFKDSYYDQKGISLKRAILASPLKLRHASAPVSHLAGCIRSSAENGRIWPLITPCRRVARLLQLQTERSHLPVGTVGTEILSASSMPAA